jgi:hypothetical protein
MKAMPWTKDEIRIALSLYEQGLPCAEIARAVVRSETALRLKLLNLGYSSRRVIVEEPDEPSILTQLDPCPEPDVVSNQEREYLERARREIELGERRRSDRERVNEAKQMLLEDRIVEEFSRQLGDLPRNWLPVLPPPSAPPTKNSHTAVLVISDVHCGQVVPAAELDGFGDYNPAIMIDRARHLELETLRILHGRPVEKLLLLFAGDIVHGNLGHSLEDDLTVPIAAQVDLAIHTFFSLLRGVASAVPAVEVYGVAGNHGRWPGMRKMPTDRRWSNLDTVFLNALAALGQHAGLDHVSFDDSIAARRVIEVGHHRLQLMHGDQVRGGAFCSTGMTREVNNATMRHVQAGRKPIDYFVMGDKHQPTSLPFGTGAFVVNGSFVGADNFGLNFLSAPPSQTLFFLHPTRGKTETHEIRLDLAEEVDAYPLKSSLKEVINQYRRS